LLYKPEAEMTENEIFRLISLRGFSAKDSVSEFSGRGACTDAAVKNIEAIGGSVPVAGAKNKVRAYLIQIK
jgi:two-component system chemotaxis sensor kinase CheA